MRRTGDVRIEFSRGNREYVAASAVDGYARISSISSASSASIRFRCVHRITYEDSTTEDLVCSEQHVGSLAFVAGTALDVPFTLSTPSAPLSYAGKLFAITYLVEVTLDYNGKREPGYEAAEFVLLPAARELDYPSSPHDSIQLEPAGLVGTAGSQIAKKAGLFIIAAIFLGSCVGPFLYFLPLLLLSKKIRGRLQLRNKGTLQILLGNSTVQAGGHLPVRAVFHSAREASDVSIHISLTAYEMVEYDSPIGRVTDERELFQKRYVMIRDEVLPLGRRTTFNTRVPVPETSSYSFDSGGAAVCWSATVVLSIPGYEDVEEIFDVCVVPPVELTVTPPPIPSRPQAVLDLPLSQTMSELHDPVSPVPVPLPVPAPETFTPPARVETSIEHRQSLVNILAGRMAQVEDPSIAKPRVGRDGEESGHLSVEEVLEEPRAASSRLFEMADHSRKNLLERASGDPEPIPPPMVLAEDLEWPTSAGASLGEIVTEVMAAGRYSSDQKTVVGKYQNYECNVQVRVRRTGPSFGISSGDDYRNGMTVIAALEGQDTDLSICFPSLRNAEVKMMLSDHPLSLRVRFKDYNSIRRQVMCEAV